MAAINLKGMDVDALLALRADIDKRLSQKRSELEKQLSRLGAESGRAAGSFRTGLGRRSALKGRKVPPPSIADLAARRGQAVALDRGGSRPSSDRAASSTSSRSIRWRERAAKSAGRKSKQVVVPLQMHDFRVWAKEFDTAASGPISALPLLANARPDADFRYRSNSTALRSSEKATYVTRRHGLYLAVCGERPVLCAVKRDRKSSVSPT